MNGLKVQLKAHGGASVFVDLRDISAFYFLTWEVSQVTVINILLRAGQTVVVLDDEDNRLKLDKWNDI